MHLRFCILYKGVILKALGIAFIPSAELSLMCKCRFISIYLFSEMDVSHIHHQTNTSDDILLVADIQ